MEFKGTKGNWNINYSNKTHFILDDNRVLIAEVDEHISNKFNTPTPRACKANAKLIADAGTTANKCGKLPSELLAERGELLSALKSCVLSMQAHPDCIDDSQFQAFVNKGWEVIAKATKQPNGFNEWIDKVHDHVKKTKL